MSYTQVTATGYNSSPPSDDGSTDSSNRVSWAKIKTGLFDPLKSAIETMNTNIASAVLSATSTLNTLNDGITSFEEDVSTLATTMHAPVGTAKLFVQTTPPTGWTKVTTYDDYALRLVTGTAGTGGSTAFTSVCTARTILTANLPVHDHSFSDASSSIVMDGTSTFLTSISDNTTQGDSGGSNRINGVSSNNITLSATWSFTNVASAGSGSGSSWDFAVRYQDCILATKS